MTFTIVEDEGKILQIRASIGTRDELLSLIEKLNRRLDDGFFEGKENVTVRTNPTSISDSIGRSGF